MVPCAVGVVLSFRLCFRFNFFYLSSYLIAGFICYLCGLFSLSLSKSISFYKFFVAAAAVRTRFFVKNFSW